YCSAAASFSVPILSALLDNPFIALYAHSHWLLKSHPTGWTTILTEGAELQLRQKSEYRSNIFHPITNYEKPTQEDLTFHMKKKMISGHP
ncbi:MAG: hypothetical protein RPU34_14665, partial [Candidatus Sedimenticola sp. (ex Thyasira tokunagai)]